MRAARFRLVVSLVYTGRAIVRRPLEGAFRIDQGESCQPDTPYSILVRSGLPLQGVHYPVLSDSCCYRLVVKILALNRPSPAPLPQVSLPSPYPGPSPPLSPSRLVHDAPKPQSRTTSKRGFSNKPAHGPKFNRPAASGQSTGGARYKE
jgi:hypothetical protein